MMMVMQTKEKYSEEQLKLRQQCLSILLKRYEITTESKYSLRDIYECAEEWTHKYKTSNGVVDYLKHTFQMGNRKTAKRLIKLAKKNPNLYTREDVIYAKLIKKQDER